MNLWKNLVLLAALSWTLGAHAGAKVTGLEWTPQGDRGRFVVAVEGGAEAPEWEVRGNRLAMTIPGATLDKGVVRYQEGVRIAAAKTNVGVLATLTFTRHGAIARDRVSITMGARGIEVTTAVPSAISRAPSTTATPTPAEERRPALVKEDLGEEFLKKLESEQTAKPTPAAETSGMAATAGHAKTAKDEVKTAQAAPARKEFSFVTYAGKFIAFLGVVLLFFWGAVQLMKKGVLGKGKLGFLNGSSLVSVLSTTYVGPKRAILMVKAHNQVFLVAAHEGGMSFLSEVHDVPGLVKEGERYVAGSNFDDETRSAGARGAEVKEKEDIYQSTPVEDKAAPKVSRDIARFSEELKKKVKNLKPLQ